MTRIAELAESISTILKERGETVGVSESSSGGLVSAALLAVPGASAYFMGGMVIYTGAARDAFAEINLDDHPGVRSSSEPFALLCAQAARRRLNTTCHTCIAETGPSEHAETLETGLSDRAENMDLFTEKTLEVFERILKNAG